MAAPKPSERLLANLRKQVKVHRRFDVRDLGDGREEQTCRACGKKLIYRHPSYNAVVKKLIAYRQANGGVSGVCPKCSKKAALERYPPR